MAEECTFCAIAAGADGRHTTRADAAVYATAKHRLYQRTSEARWTTPEERAPYVDLLRDALGVTRS